MAHKIKRYVRCKKCGTLDAPGMHCRTIDGQHTHPKSVGTSVEMVCPDCSDGTLNAYGHPLATMCRFCCPTGHGTHAQGEL